MRHGIKTLLYSLTWMLMSNTSFAQDEIDQPAPDPAQEIWGAKQNESKNNVFDQTDQANGKWRPPTRTNTVNTPIDGGVLVLLGAGVLYGRKRYVQLKKRATNVSI